MTSRKRGVVAEAWRWVRPKSGGPRAERVRTGVLVALLVLVLAALALGQSGYEDSGVDQLDRAGPNPIKQIQQTWHRWSKVLVWTAAVLLLLVALRLINPFRIHDAVSERMLKRSLRGVDDLLKRIQEEAEAATEDAAKEETVVEEGLLGGLAEVAEFNNAEQVPSYVLTVNDLMLDNIRVTLKRLRRFHEGNAERYRDYMFSVLKGIKTLTEQSAEAGVGSGLAVDMRDYFEDDRRYQAWSKLLGRAARRGRHQDIAQGFLRFMKDIKMGRPLAAPKQTPTAGPETPAVSVARTPEVPKVVNEETLPAIQQAAAREARAFYAWVQTTKTPDDTYAWQFELVRRQQQIHLKDEAQRMLAVFLSHERKSLRAVTKIRMLPCRTWEHILRLLGVESDAQLQERIEDKLLTTQEIIILEKAFLQTFAKKESLGFIYGRDKDADLMMDLHMPQIRHQALAVLRKLRPVEPGPLDDATQALNDEETPLNNHVRRLIEHYIHHRQDPPR